jgi:hypothetical protein
MQSAAHNVGCARCNHRAAVGPSHTQILPITVPILSITVPILPTWVCRRSVPHADTASSRLHLHGCPNECCDSCEKSCACALHALQRNHIAQDNRARITRCMAVQVKKAIKEKDGAFRAMFEDKVASTLSRHLLSAKSCTMRFRDLRELGEYSPSTHQVLMSDIVFLRSWVPVTPPALYSPVTTLMQPYEVSHRPSGPIRCSPSVPCHICTGTGLTAATSAPGLVSPAATSAPGLVSPRPHLHRDWARPCRVCHVTG